MNQNQILARNSAGVIALAVDCPSKDLVFLNWLSEQVVKFKYVVFCSLWVIPPESNILLNTELKKKSKKNAYIKCFKLLPAKFLERDMLFSKKGILIFR
jgi:hypothetical protein